MTSALQRRRLLYGRRTGHKLRPERKATLEEWLPQLRLPLDRLSDRAALFPGPIDQIWLEIGFGAGEHLLAQALAHPRIGLIGCEPFVNGVAKLVSEIARHGLENVRIHPGDARDVLDQLPARSLSRVFVLFPDPWPKKRHWKRRFICAENLIALARVMHAGAELRVASDEPDYLEWARAEAAAEGSFVIAAELSARPTDWPPTRYEEKAQRAGRNCKYMTLLRR